MLSDPANVLDANTAFVSLTLFNLLRIPLNILPMLIVFLVQCQVSVQRINKFMNAGELVSLTVFGMAAMPLPLLFGDCINDKNLSNI